MRVCFVSQFEGDASPWNAPINDCRAWAYVLGGDTRNVHTILREPAELGAYELVIVELTPNAYAVPPFVRRHVPGAVVVGLVEGGVEAVSAQAGWEQLLFLEALEALDVLGVLVEEALPYYRVLAGTEAKAQWLGVPYPKAWTDSLQRGTRADGARVVELGAGLERGRNGLAALRVLERVRRDVPDLRGRVYAGDPGELELIARAADGVEGALKSDWPSYYRHHLDAWAVLSLDPRRSWGRLVLDCAAAGIPYVGSNATHCAQHAGVLVCDPYDVEAAEEMLRRLAEDDELYAEAVTRQYEALGQFDEEASRSRFASALAAAGIRP
ncbi:MAG: hypothetical protein WD689_07380 [Gaiellaceae bacterium]